MADEAGPAPALCSADDASVGLSRNGDPPPASKTNDLEALRKAVEDAASASGNLWLSYLFTLFYLLIAAGAVTHQDLFFEKPVKLPFLSVDLPLRAFFALGPPIFLVLHGYVLLHFVVLSGKIGAYDGALLAQVPDRDERQSLRRQLPSSIFVQFLAGPREVRHGVSGFLLRLIAWISLVIGPLILFLFFELQFLPYHDETITWTHRTFVLLDIVLLWMLWPKVLQARADEVARSRIVPIAERMLCGMFSLLVLAIPFGVATFPGEWLAVSLPYVPLRAALLEGTTDDITRRPRSPLSNVLVLPGLDAIDHAKFDNEDKIAAAKETVSLRGRHLEGAVLYDAILRKADLTGARLQGASLRRAQLQGASLVGAQLQGASLNEAELQGASLHYAQLQGASLDGAELQRGSLDRAQLQGASLVGAQLQGASLVDAELQGASLHYAQLQGASLNEAKLQGASLLGAQLQGASLVGAQLQGASLNEAKLQGASLLGAHLQGASLNEAELQGAWLDAEFQGASLNRAQLQGASLVGAHLQGASLNDAQLQGASLDRAQLQGASLNNAQLQGASLNNAQLQGASLKDAKLGGASLFRAQLQGASLDGGQLFGASLFLAQLQGASLNNAQLWGASLEDVFVWRTTGQIVEAQAIKIEVKHLITEPRRPCSDRELEGSDWFCEWSKADFETLKRELSTVVPEGHLREEALKRIDPTLNPDPALDSDRAIAEAWQSIQASNSPNAELEEARAEVEFGEARAKVLMWVGCEPDGAPFVVAALAGRLGVDSSDIFVESPLDKLAAAVLRDDCPGAQGISAETRATLMKLAKPTASAALPVAIP